EHCASAISGSKSKRKIRNKNLIFIAIISEYKVKKFYSIIEIKCHEACLQIKLYSSIMMLCTLTPKMFAFSN
ncbi:MAG: hypothetical protein R3353_10160, partial [Salegentibacter mishustinae]|nr:hypothetical protein [Salegentibacter mishustinae]